MRTGAAPAELLVLGLGNVLCGDDGLGSEAVDRLRRRYHLPPGVRALDGGTLGLSLLPFLHGTRSAILLDAIRGEGPPETLVRLEGDEVAPAVRDRLSVHQVGVVDLLGALHWLGEPPERLVLLGLVPRTLDLGVGLSPGVAAALPGLVAAAAREIRELGFPLRPRSHRAAADPLDRHHALPRRL